MTVVMKRYKRLFEREPDTLFGSFDELYTQTLRDQENSSTRWIPPANIYATVYQDQFKVKVTGDRPYELNDWSFTQLCSYPKTDRKVIECLAPTTAAQVISEIFPVGQMPLQLFTTGTSIRSFHQIRYERLLNPELLDVVLEEAERLTGKFNERSNRMAYFMGDRDMFAYLVDESTWTHYRDEKFATAFVVWNSEVGGRSVGFRSGWYHAGTNSFMLRCEDANLTYSRRHSLRIRESIEQIRQRIQLWELQIDDRCTELLDQMIEAAQCVLSKSESELQRYLIASGLLKEHAKETVKWLADENRTFTRFNVSIAVMAVAATQPFASTRYDLALVSGQIMQRKPRVA